MGHRQKRVARVDEHVMRDQEVLRATKELAAYFKGRRTELEARAALKIIKAYVRSREALDPKHRPPLPGFPPVRAAAKPAARKPAKLRKRGGKIANLAPLPEPVPATLTE